MGLGGIAAFLVGYLVKQNTDLSKANLEQSKANSVAQADHQKELVKLVSDGSASQTILAEAIRDDAAAKVALADGLKAIAKALDHMTRTVSA